MCLLYTIICFSFFEGFQSLMVFIICSLLNLLRVLRFIFRCFEWCVLVFYFVEPGFAKVTWAPCCRLVSCFNDFCFVVFSGDVWSFVAKPVSP